MSTGLGVLINALSDNDSTAVVAACVGKKIADVKLVEDVLRFTFDDGSKLSLLDDGQSSCENRFMETVDDLSTFAGDVFRGIEIREAPDVPAEYDDAHEVQFLVVHTDKGSFTMSSHNEHNGYYGGFWIRAKAE